MTPPATTITLDRWTASKLNAGQGPYEGIDVDGDGERDEWKSNWRTVYVQRKAPHRVSLKPMHGYAKLLTAVELKAVKATAAKRGWKLDVDEHPLTIVRERWAHLGGDLDCDEDLLDRLERVAEELGVEVWVRSGRRTMAEQWALYNELGPGIAAYPSATAPHVRGIAADCGINGVNIGAFAGAREAMKRHGLSLRVPGENWHVEVGTAWNA